jgi:hypothetical protein
MSGKSIEQRISDTETRIQQLEAQKRLLDQHLKEQERKERTRRLIQIGAIMARLGVDPVEKAQALQRVVEKRPEVRAWLSQITEVQSPANGEPAAEPTNK